MTRDEVNRLMKSSKNATEWDNNCDRVKLAVANGQIKEVSGDYPVYWYEDIILSGLYSQLSRFWLIH